MESAGNIRESPERNSVILENLNSSNANEQNGVTSIGSACKDTDSKTSHQCECIAGKSTKNKEVWENVAKKDLTQSVQNLRSVTHQLLKKSSIRAVSKVGHAKTNTRKVLWILVLVIGLTGCVYEVYRFLYHYYQYPVVININVEEKWSLVFPAVTVCSLDAIEKRRFSCAEENSSSKNCEDTMAEACDSQVGVTQDEKWRFNYKMLTKFSQMSFIEHDEVGREFRNLMRYCTFDGETCIPDRFHYFQSFRYGNCFTFNKRYNDTMEVLKTSSVGSLSGLDLVIDLDHVTYIPSDLRIFIHHPNEDPNLEEEDVAISPGYETSISVKQTCFKRLPEPYKDRCVVYGESPKVKGNNRYECVKMYIQEQNHARCSCIDPKLPELDNLRYCNNSNLSEFCCLKKALVDLATQGMPSECPLSCFSTTYTLQQWSSATMNFQSFCGFCNDKANFKVPIRQARLKVFYSSLERTVFEQNRMYQESEIFSQLGGQFGLWLGLSLVSTLFEIVENLYDIFKYLIKHHFC